MLNLDLIILVFAPATVGLAVTALCRTKPSVYWAGMLAIITLALIGFGRSELGAGLISPMALALVVVVTPTIAAFIVGRLISPNRGGAYIFAGTCTAYLIALAPATGVSVLMQWVIQ